MNALAVLPMYDWPQVRTATDALWHLLRDDLRAAGIAAPDELMRGGDLMAVWTSPTLVLGQTCGLPYATRLMARVQLVGTPDYGLDGCPPGHYRSAWVVRADERRTHLAEFSDATFAYNAEDSQSGHAVARGIAFAQRLATGAHAASIASVAAGRADIAAIDAVSWRLALAHLPAANGLRVLDWSPPTPGLPLICANGLPVATIRAVVAARLAVLPVAIVNALGIGGLVAGLTYGR